MVRARLGAAALVIVLGGVARAGGAAEDPVPWPELSSGPLQDNSFLIEEAYNEEAGVVQHILTGQWDRKSGDWQAVFTQEWPVPDETHQLSFTVPYSWLAGPDGARGPGDVLLNYRYQLRKEDGRGPAVAPRLSLVLPTGSVHDGLGDGSTGFQTLLPVSKQLGEHWAAHLNFGATVIPRARAAGVAGSDRLLSWLGGGSVIWEPWQAINFLAEMVATRDAELGARGVEYHNRLTLDPGTRIGWNGPGGIQWVWGIGLPIGLTSDTEHFGVFLYFSLEHAVTASARAERNW